MAKPNIDPKIFQKHAVKIAYLFGSRAKDFHHPKSDFDIGVLFKDNNKDGLELYDKASRLGMELAKYFPAEVDVRILNNAPSLFRYEVISNSLLLYCENENERIEFEVRSAKEYIDDQHMRDIYTQAVIDKISRGVFR